ncbi:hypothetical protein GGE07_001378 [Sinorhizobium terangae]|nr:hypothetical protein [Sinorhizobium terangae]
MGLADAFFDAQLLIDLSFLCSQQHCAGGARGLLHATTAALSHQANPVPLRPPLRRESFTARTRRGSQACEEHRVTERRGRPHKMHQRPNTYRLA